MGLSKEDEKPDEISFADAYEAIRTWYQANVDIIKDQGGDYASQSVMLIDNLPDPNSLSELETRAVLGEVIYGNLEWGFHKSDGKYKMASYAHAALEAKQLSFSLSENERQILKDSKLWRYLSINKGSEISDETTFVFTLPEGWDETAVSLQPGYVKLALKLGETPRQALRVYFVSLAKMENLGIGGCELMVAMNEDLLAQMGAAIENNITIYNPKSFNFGLATGEGNLVTQITRRDIKIEEVLLGYDSNYGEKYHQEG